MIKKLRKDVRVVPEFSDSSTQARGQIEKMKTIIAEKETERGKLKENYSKARKSRHSKISHVRNGKKNGKNNGKGKRSR
jgi:hypothetical protein